MITPNRDDVLTETINWLRQSIETQIADLDDYEQEVDSEYSYLLKNLNHRIRGWIDEGLDVDDINSAICEDFPTLRDQDGFIRPDCIAKYLGFIPSVAAHKSEYPDCPNLAKAMYIRGVVRNHFPVTNEGTCLDFIISALDNGIVYRELLEAAEETQDYEKWRDRVWCSMN